MRFIHTADWHLGTKMTHASFRNATAHADRVREIEDTVYRLLDRVKDTADILFICGDLFDHARIPVSKIEAVFERLNATGKPVFIVVGNHDEMLQTKAYAHLNRLENVHVFDGSLDPVRIGDVDVYGLNTHDFSVDKLHTIDENLNPDRINVLCLHGDVINPKDAHYLTDVKTLQKTAFDYIALGHIHKHAFLAPHIAYSGNLEPIDFSETEPKGYLTGTLKKDPEASFEAFASRRFVVKKMSLTPDDTTHDIRKKVDDAFTRREKKTDLLRVIFQGDVSPYLTLDAAFFETLAENHYHLECVDDTRVDLDLAQLKKAYKDTIIEAVIDDYDPKKDDEASLKLAIRALLESGDEA